MNLPDNFEFGRFKLESYFVKDFQHSGKMVSCNIVINGYTMLAQLKTNASFFVIAKTCAIAELTVNMLAGINIPVMFNGESYNLKIENKEWVFMEKNSK